LQLIGELHAESGGAQQVHRISCAPAKIDATAHFRVASRSFEEFSPSGVVLTEFRGILGM